MVAAVVAVGWHSLVRHGVVRIVVATRMAGVAVVVVTAMVVVVAVVAVVAVGARTRCSEQGEKVPGFHFKSCVHLHRGGTETMWFLIEIRACAVYQ